MFFFKIDTFPKIKSLSRRICDFLFVQPRILHHTLCVCDSATHFYQSHLSKAYQCNSLLVSITIQQYLFLKKRWQGPFVFLKGRLFPKSFFLMTIVNFLRKSQYRYGFSYGQTENGFTLYTMTTVCKSHIPLCYYAFTIWSIFIFDRDEKPGLERTGSSFVSR